MRHILFLDLPSVPDPLQIGGERFIDHLRDARASVLQDPLDHTAAADDSQIAHD